MSNDKELLILQAQIDHLKKENAATRNIIIGMLPYIRGVLSDKNGNELAEIVGKHYQEFVHEMRAARLMEKRSGLLDDHPKED